MGLLGDLLSLPVKVVNAPIKAFEDLVDDSIREEDRLLSKPLKKLADALENVDE